jgi:hypothetical protein
MAYLHYNYNSNTVEVGKEWQNHSPDCRRRQRFQTCKKLTENGVVDQCNHSYHYSYWVECTCEADLKLTKQSPQPQPQQEWDPKWINKK